MIELKLLELNHRDALRLYGCFHCVKGRCIVKLANIYVTGQISTSARDQTVDNFPADNEIVLSPRPALTTLFVMRPTVTRLFVTP